MYAREVKGQTLTLGVSGMLWDNSLVMVDSETNSLWSHILGEAKSGTLAGETLETIPSVITDWASWKARYPQTTVVIMKRTANEYTRTFHGPDSGLVIGITDQRQADGSYHARSWSFEELSETPVINSRFVDQPVLVAYDKASGTAVLYERLVDGRELTFEEKGGKLVDRETGSEWDRITGIATTAPMKGKRLKLLPAIISDGSAWQRFHADPMLQGE